MTYLVPALHELGWFDRQQLVKDKLSEPVLAVLKRFGALPIDAISYFLETNQDMLIHDQSLRHVIRELERADKIVSYWIDDNREVYAINLRDEQGGLLHPVRFTVPDNYINAYYRMALRYQAIRENPELATMSEDYIDALYNPQPEMRQQ